MNKKSTPIIALGLAVFVIGGALLFLLLRNNDHTTAKRSGASSSGVSTPTTAQAGPASPTIGAGSTVRVPPGLNAVSVQMDYFNGAGGFAHAGDVVNIYEVANKDCANPKANALGVKLAIPGAKVLSVSESPAAQTGQPANYLLGVSPQDAERLIFLKTGYSLYFAIANPGDPAPATPGITCTNGL